MFWHSIQWYFWLLKKKLKNYKSKTEGSFPWLKNYIFSQQNNTQVPTKQRENNKYYKLNESAFSETYRKF